MTPAVFSRPPRDTILCAVVEAIKASVEREILPPAESDARDAVAARMARHRRAKPPAAQTREERRDALRAALKPASAHKWKSAKLPGDRYLPIGALVCFQFYLSCFPLGVIDDDACQRVAETFGVDAKAVKRLVHTVTLAVGGLASPRAGDSIPVDALRAWGSLLEIVRWRWLADTAHIWVPPVCGYTAGRRSAAEKDRPLTLIPLVGEGAHVGPIDDWPGIPPESR